MKILIIVLATGLASGSFDYTGRATMQDFKTFLQAGSKIYLYYRSYSRQMNGGDPKCIYINHVTVLNATSFAYTEGYRKPDGRSIVYTVRARISKNYSADSPPVIRATRSGLQRKYRFEYFDTMAACAVITFSDGKCTTKCELHIWAGNVASGPSENCKREYDYSCPGRKMYQVYDNTCF
uniref:Lipocalin n=1 Tax=Rhipicephalus zambeziensis TaxID=60191 RepID=A0A224YDM9_9ACAR